MKQIDILDAVEVAVKELNLTLRDAKRLEDAYLNHVLESEPVVNPFVPAKKPSRVIESEESILTM
jgi:hypothetical protein